MHVCMLWDIMHYTLDSIMFQRENCQDIKQDFLEPLELDMKNRREDGEEDTKLKDNILTLLVAGHDTTIILIHSSSNFLMKIQLFWNN